MIDRAPSPGDPSLRRAAWLVVAGALLSGPIGLAIAAIHPQPPWRDAETFANHFHPLQQMPYWFGFLLLGGSVWFVARAATIAGEHERTRALGALACAGAFAALVGINYTLQVAYVPYLARAHDPAVAWIAMTSPGAFCWAFEMFGYGFLGVATWLLARQFRTGPYGRALSALLQANGIVSVTGAILTAADFGWILRPSGLAAFAAWNALFIALMALTAIAYRRRSDRRRTHLHEGIV